jgi:nudix-type nucleoside diphosphatase (YffH/AdpP family)
MTSPATGDLAPMTIRIEHTETIYQGFGHYLVVTLRLPDGQTLRREIEDHGVAAAVLAFDAERRTAILVRQFRAPVYFAARQPETLEVVAGMVEGPDPAECARREAFEEAGLALKTLDHVVTAWTMPGISTERIDLYLATYSPADRIGDGGGLPEEHEAITVVEIGLGELARMADAGVLTDAKTLILVQTLRLRRPELFGVPPQMGV